VIVVRSSYGSLLLVGVRIVTTGHSRFLDNIGGTFIGSPSLGYFASFYHCPDPGSFG
jgi:hypothetical protein